MALLATAWGARLTYNFARRGGYSWPPWSGEEDYRWSYCRQWPVLNTRIGWLVFNIVFISLYQNLLLALMALPILARANTSLSVVDLALAATFLWLLLLETVADQQQYEFQTAKWSRINSGQQLEQLEPPYSTGFVTWGLFSKCRHPNYLAEQLLWVVFYGFSAAATGQVVNHFMVGVTLLIDLFLGSRSQAQGITYAKYPSYARYISLVPPYSLLNMLKLQTSYPPLDLHQE